MARPKKHHVIIGQRYGTRTVTKDLGMQGPHTKCEVVCDCGLVSQTEVHNLASGHGCVRRCTVGLLASDRDAERQRTLEERAKARKEAWEAFKEKRRANLQALADQGLTQREIAERCEMHQSVVNRILRGIR